MPTNDPKSCCIALFKCFSCGAKGIWYLSYVNNDISKVEGRCNNCDIKPIHKSVKWSDGHVPNYRTHKIYENEDDVYNWHNLEPVDEVSHANHTTGISVEDQ